MKIEVDPLKKTVKMFLPDVSRDKVENALAEFDKKLRDDPDWINWENNESHKWAIEFNQKLYPVKKIISMSTGVSVNSFSGGEQANSYITKMGFSVIRLKDQENAIQKLFNEILERYATARINEEFGKKNYIWETFDRISKLFQNIDPIIKRPSIVVQWSTGKGTWAKVPWIAFIDNRETNSTQRGVYCDYLFRQDMSGIYLVYAQGVTEIKKRHGSVEGLKILRQRSQNLRNDCQWLSGHGFKLDNGVDLHADPGLGSDYEASIIAHKYYEKNNVPTDIELMSDLESALKAYDHYLESKKTSRPIDSVIEWINNIGTNVSPDGKLAYKAVVLLGLLDILEKNPEHENLFLYNDLYNGFLELEGQYNFSFTEDQFSQPYTRLRNDNKPLQVWLPNISGNLGIDDSKIDQPHYVKSTLPSIKIDDSVWPCFVSNEDREKIRSEILKRWPTPIKRIRATYSLSECSNETGFPLEILERWVRAIERKKQAILYGPPGTGKTFIAEKLTKHIIGGGDGFSDLVQFHPSYSYEDFVQGIRPKARNDGCLYYPTLPGRFLEFSVEANKRNDKCVLIIDEINRANLSRVFGELMYLLEYRDREVQLASGGTFSIPSNIRIIGTMNTADRSIALVDHALRRRFAFLALHPDYEILKMFHNENSFPVGKLVEILARLNNEINDPHYEIGITFFLQNDLSNLIEDIWKMEIEPYLEEYFFDRQEKVDDYRWEKIKEKIT